MDRDAWIAVGTTLGVTVVLFGLFVAMYWAVRGFFPGSRLYEQELPGPNELDAKTATFTMFYTNWCPHCKTAKPIWASFEQLMKNQQYTYGGKTVQLTKVNCQIDPGQCSRYRVDAYPTFKLETNSKLYEYVGPADGTTWRTFLTTALGSETATASR